MGKWIEPVEGDRKTASLSEDGILKIHQGRYVFTERNAGDPMPDENGPVPGKKQSRLAPFSPEEDSIIGSYSSFFGFLLILTILSYRHIILTVIDMVHTGLPDADIIRIAIAMMLIFTLIFIVIPAYPILAEIRLYLRGRGKKLAWMLIFLFLLYTVALIFQLISVYQEVMVTY